MATSSLTPFKLNVSGLLIYLFFIAASVSIFFLICTYGEELLPPPSVGSVARSVGSGHTLLHVLVALVAIVIVGHIFSVVLKRLAQPPVIGEVIAGIALGPTLLGPTLSAQILTPDAAPYLGILAQIGVMLYLFGVGLDLDLAPLRRHTKTVIAVSHVSMALPFLLGAGLALLLYPRLSSGGVSFTAFALFIGLSLSVTAFPVLARILTDRGLIRTELGSLALSCAAVGDVAAWCLLAVVVGVVQSDGGRAISILGGAAFYLIVMFAAVRPFLSKLAFLRTGSGGAGVLALGAMLISSLTTEFIGIHALFGAFLLGAIMPREEKLRMQIEKLAPLVQGVLLPAFFAYTGMRTQIGLISGNQAWLLCCLIIGTATLGKFAGSYVAARITGMRSHQAAALGALMNTRGLMELVVLNVGLDLGLISPILFAMMVIMALVATLAAAPILDLLGIREEAGV